MNTNNVKWLWIAVATFVVSVVVATIISFFIVKNHGVSNQASLSNMQQAPSTFVAMSEDSPIASHGFVKAAEATVNTVVHVRTKSPAKQVSFSHDPFFDFFFGRPQMERQEPRMQEGAGSGVIISSDGYIVTNNHVVTRSTSIEVTLNDKRTFEATLIGSDPNTDIALIKIDAKDLPVSVFGDSDALSVGEWVLAVGNPFNLTSTVTAGIVSAKARSINILSGDMKIESFIQTDAAINPGNSGGALVNLQGELVGINTAIATPTGSYTGYGFAVPSSIVQKVVLDLKQFGAVQRAVLGVQIGDITNELAKEKDLKTLNGVYLHSVVENGAADKAGLKAEDIIQQINGIRVNTVAQLQEQLSRFRPGDQVTIQVLRKNKELTVRATLKNKLGNTDVVNSQVDVEKYFEIKVKEIDNQTKNQLRLSYGLQISELKKGKLFDQGIKNNYIIVSVNNQAIRTKDDLQQALDTALHAADRNKVLFITGVYPNGVRAYYAINLDE
jgi:serine protease Do